MKISKSIEINKPIDEVWEFFMDEDFAYKWQPGLRSIELLEGEKGMEGSKNKMHYEENGRTIDMIEEIIEVKKHVLFKSIYTANGVWNLHSSMFKQIQDNKTLYEVDTEFKFTTFMFRLMGLFMGFMFKNRVQQDLEAFKNAVESE